MKRQLLVFISILIFVSASANAQSILGIKVGESYTNALKYLQTRYGYIHPPVEENGNLYLTNFDMGGVTFNYGTLYFQWDMGREARLIGAEFQKWTSVNDTLSMKHYRDYIKDALSSKYTVLSRINNQGFKCYAFCSDEESNGIVMNGTLDLERSKGKNGKENLYLILTYAPEGDFIHHNSDF